VVDEFPLTLYLNQDEWLTLLCSPDHLEELTYGFLKSEGMIKMAGDIQHLTVDRQKGHGYISLFDLNPLTKALHGRRTQTAGCGKGITFYSVLDTVSMPMVQSDLLVTMDQLSQLMRLFNGSSPVFQETGGVHSCALCTPEEILWVMEDIGRHNALDKLIGKAMLAQISLEDKLLLTSGRVSSEILLKCARVGLSTVVSRSAPTQLAVEEAKKLQMTLVGFLRGRKGNIYAGRERIKGLCAE
jgi:FdhD protein